MIHFQCLVRVKKKEVIRPTDLAEVQSVQAQSLNPGCRTVPGHANAPSQNPNFRKGTGLAGRGC
jgi:hypothetical protein